MQQPATARSARTVDGHDPRSSPASRLVRVSSWSRWWRSLGPALVTVDLAAVLVAAALTAALTDAPVGALGALLAAVAAAALVGAAGLHRTRLVLSVVDELPLLLVAATVATALLLLTGSVVHHAAVAVCTGTAYGLLVVGHAVVHGVVHLLRRTGRLGGRAVVVGCGAAGREVATALQDHPDLGLAPVGFVRTSSEADLGRLRGLPLTLLGDVEALPRAMVECRADAVVVALPAPAGAAEAAAVEGALAAPGRVYAVPRHLPPAAAAACPGVGAERVSGGAVGGGRALGGGIVVGDVAAGGVAADGGRAGGVRGAGRVGGGVALVRLDCPVGRLLRVVRRGLGAVTAVVTLAFVGAAVALLAVPVLLETGGLLVRHREPTPDGGSRTVWSLRTRRAHWLARPGTTWSVAVAQRPGPLGRLLARTGLVALPEVGHEALVRLRPRLARSARPPAAVPGPGSGAPAVGDTVPAVAAAAAGVGAPADEPPVDLGRAAR